MFPFWSKPTKKALRELQEAKRAQLEEHDAAVQRFIDQAHEGDELSGAGQFPEPEGGVWIDTGSGPGYVRQP